MVARDCMFCHEDHCTALNVIDYYSCKFMVFTDSVLIGCSAENSDLVDCPEELEHLFIP